MGMEHWWNDTDRGQQRYCCKLICHCVNSCPHPSLELSSYLTENSPYRFQPVNIVEGNHVIERYINTFFKLMNIETLQQMVQIVTTERQKTLKCVSYDIRKHLPHL